MHATWVFSAIEVAVHWVEQVHTLTFDQGDASSPLELGLLHEIRYLTKKGKKNFIVRFYLPIDCTLVQNCNFVDPVLIIWCAVRQILYTVQAQLTSGLVYIP